MKAIKIAGATLNQTPFDWNNNKKNILDAIKSAKKEKISVLCLPELCITGYGCEDMFQSISFIEKGYQILNEILDFTEDIIVAVGLPVFFKKSIFNVACLISNKKIIGFTTKRFLAGDGVHYEPRWFKSWPVGVMSKIEVNGDLYPIGDIHFEISGIKIGFEICEDAWVSKRPGADLSHKGVDIILNPSASHFAFGKFNTRKNFVVEGSRSFNVAYVYTNLLGCESGRVIFDGGNIIASGGNLLAQGSRFSFKSYNLSSAVIEIDKIRMEQSKVSSFQSDLEDSFNLIKFDGFKFPDLTLDIVDKKLDILDWENSKSIKKEEFSRAVSLGLFDYLRKSFSQGFVVSLSGGADSGAVASLIYLMASLAINDLGIIDFKKKLSHIKKIQNEPDLKSIINKILICAYQPSENSGNVTKNAAEQLSEEIGANYFEIDISNIINEYINIISKSIGRSLNWDDDDIALQNIQARSRGPSIWMLANINNALLLTTSNRSEAAVGYATMDGDTCGGLAPIGGIDKHFLREWLLWFESYAPEGVSPVKKLQLINGQEPTAELRPNTQKQTDEKDLMPYEILDLIERIAIGDKRLPLDIYKILIKSFPDNYSKEDLYNWVVRFFNLWSKNQWKRERYAPAFHLDDKNLDPKTWCRFPILSGGFKSELEDLKDYYNDLL